MTQDIEHAVALIGAMKAGDRFQTRRALHEGIENCGFGFLAGLAAVGTSLLGALESTSGREATTWLNEIAESDTRQSASAAS